MTKFVHIAMILAAALLATSQAEANGRQQRDPAARAYVKDCEDARGKIVTHPGGRLDCKGANRPVAGNAPGQGRTASREAAPGRASIRDAAPARDNGRNATPVTGLPTDEQVEAEFRDDCGHNAGKVFTAEEWNAMRPGANLPRGALHCRRPARWVVEKK